jgi:hypothetical protein
MDILLFSQILNENQIGHVEAISRDIIGQAVGTNYSQTSVA